MMLDFTSGSFKESWVLEIQFRTPLSDPPARFGVNDVKGVGVGLFFPKGDSYTFCLLPSKGVEMSCCIQDI